MTTLLRSWALAEAADARFAHFRCYYAIQWLLFAVTSTIDMGYAPPTNRLNVSLSCNNVCSPYDNKNKCRAATCLDLYAATTY